ncbi:MAG: hypothetical protein M1834_008953 [Cirrosporium novae-zelandiae]|nr:MAG: hypothetical protein M1834_008953 [Cirrosporium novae-zelandiae]
MAQVFIPPSPHAIPNMSTRRVPLANVPNATNSPYRATNAASSKRSRSQSSVLRELPYGQPPPAKKQMLRKDDQNPRAMLRRTLDDEVENRHYRDTKTLAKTQTIELIRRKVSGEESHKTIRRVEKKEEVRHGDSESIVQWQRHYRKAFPEFVFYFESVPDDARVKLSKQVLSLGAREEKFFSKTVTHVITTKTIPPESDVTSEETTAMTPTSNTEADSQPRTINPSLLDRLAESTQAQSTISSKGRTVLDLAYGHRIAAGNRHESYTSARERREHQQNVDILHRARQMGIKIWALEKLQRVLNAILDPEAGYQSHHGRVTRSNTNAKSTNAKGAEHATDLSQLLRQEKVNGPADRTDAREIILFKGPFIYVRDMNEKTKPTMAREYAKVSHREDGEWPQFRSASYGKCPFVEDSSKHHAEKAEVKQRKVSRDQPAPKAKASVTIREVPEDTSTATAHSKVTKGVNPPTARALAPKGQGEPIKLSEQPMFSGAQDLNNVDPSKAHSGLPRGPRTIGGEPVASGIQPSNLTSAIRSQVISSTASAPGVKAGTSKNMYELKRKALVNNSGGCSTGGIPSSHRIMDLASVLKNKEESTPPVRAAKRKAQEKLGYVDEENMQEDRRRRVVVVRKTTTARYKHTAKRDAKPGYCENCKEKFDDFDEVGSLLKYIFGCFTDMERVASNLSKTPKVCGFRQQLLSA